VTLLGFDFPESLHYLVERDMWCELLPDGRARIGITGFGVRISGHFFMCRPKPVGTAVEQGATVAVAELNKSVVTIKTPVTGVVQEVNPLLVDTPEVIEHDPYGRGWLVVMAPTRWTQDAAQLCHGPQLAEVMTARMRLENEDFSGKDPA
jgi:glycine cleavage system H protein